MLFEWKPLLTRLVDEGLCQPRDEAQADSINSALDFMDDDHWPAVVRTRHGVDCSIKRLKATGRFSRSSWRRLETFSATRASLPPCWSGFATSGLRTAS